jgi:hypothetical protein
MDYARKKILQLEMQAVQSARYSSDLNIARAAIEREEELRKELAAADLAEDLEPMARRVIGA